METNEFQLTFIEEDKMIKANELSHFLYYFRVAYAVAVENFQETSVMDIINNTEKYHDEMAHILETKLAQNKITSLFLKNSMNMIY